MLACFKGFAKLGVPFCASHNKNDRNYSWSTEEFPNSGKLPPGLVQLTLRVQDPNKYLGTSDAVIILVVQSLGKYMIGEYLDL